MLLRKIRGRCTGFEPPLEVSVRVFAFIAVCAALLAAERIFTIGTAVSCGAQGCQGDVLRGDTYIFGGWSHAGFSQINGTNVPGTIFGMFNDGETRTCAAVPVGGNVTLIKLTRIDMAAPANTVMTTVNCMAGAGLSGNELWNPAPRGTCTAGYSQSCSWKSLGITHVNGRLYLQVFRQEAAVDYFGHDSTLLRSDDEGATWINPAHAGGPPRADGDFPAGPGDATYPASIMWPAPQPRDPSRQSMARLGFVHYCQDESIGCPSIDDNQTYVYATSTSGTFLGFVLARVSKANLPHLRAAEWQYYTCPGYAAQVCDGSLAASWTADPARVTQLTGGASGADPQVIWADGLKQYVASGFDGLGNVILSTAPHVWGPWAQAPPLAPGHGTEVFNNVLLPTYRTLGPGHATVILANNSYTLDPGGTLYLYQLDLRWPVGRPVETRGK
jgi:hypothetical protein